MCSNEQIAFLKLCFVAGLPAFSYWATVTEVRKLFLYKRRMRTVWQAHSHRSFEATKSFGWTFEF